MRDAISKNIDKIPKNERHDIEVTFTVYQEQISSLTIIVLPKIHEDPKNEESESKLFKGYVQNYTRNIKCLFLNVLDCSTDFSRCLSRKILEELGIDGKHTVSILTKVELASESVRSELSSIVFEKSTPFGYFYAVDKIEQDAFNFLPNFDEGYAGYEAISKNIVVAMLSIICHPTSLIVKTIEADLLNSEFEIDIRTKVYSSTDAIVEISSIMSLASGIINNLFQSREYDAYSDDRFMHGACQIDTKFDGLRKDLQDLKLNTRMPFLALEIGQLDITNDPNPTNYIPVSVAKRLLTEQFSFVSVTIDKFVSNLISYLEDVVEKVLFDMGKKDSLIFSLNLEMISKLFVKNVKLDFQSKVNELIELERMGIYTCKSDFGEQVKKMKKVKLEFGKDFISVDGFGDCIYAKHFKNYEKDELEWAFEVKKVMIVYWKFLVDRFVDTCALNLRALLKKWTAVGSKDVMEKQILELSKAPKLKPVEARNKATLVCRANELKKARDMIKKWQKDYEFLL